MIGSNLLGDAIRGRVPCKYIAAPVPPQFTRGPFSIGLRPTRKYDYLHGLYPNILNRVGTY